MSKSLITKHDSNVYINQMENHELPSPEIPFSLTVMQRIWE